MLQSENKQYNVIKTFHSFSQVLKTALFSTTLPPPLQFKWSHFESWLACLPGTNREGRCKRAQTNKDSLACVFLYFSQFACFYLHSFWQFVLFYFSLTGCCDNCGLGPFPLHYFTLLWLVAEMTLVLFWWYSIEMHTIAYMCYSLPVWLCMYL